LFRVRAGCDPLLLRPLSGACGSGPGNSASDDIGAAAAAGAGLLIVALLLLATRRANRARRSRV
nr:hypothetical protein [Actinomycetota bacterium]